MVIVAGLPGTGKSLLVHQLVHVAHGAGRVVHLLQWDVARPVFEASPAGRRYPLDDGVTHAVIRRAAGLWVRDAVADWNERYADDGHLLVGEAPFVGNRFVELAQRIGDRAEGLLTAAWCRFAIATPSIPCIRASARTRRRTCCAICGRASRRSRDAPARPCRTIRPSTPPSIRACSATETRRS